MFVAVADAVVVGVVVVVVVAVAVSRLLVVAAVGNGFVVCSTVN